MGGAQPGLQLSPGARALLGLLELERASEDRLDASCSAVSGDGRRGDVGDISLSVAPGGEASGALDLASLGV